MLRVVWDRPLGGTSKSAKGGKTLVSQIHQNREAYFIAGSGSATDDAKPAARLKMATKVEARITSNVGKVG